MGLPATTVGIPASTFAAHACQAASSRRPLSQLSVCCTFRMHLCFLGLPAAAVPCHGMLPRAMKLRAVIHDRELPLCSQVPEMQRSELAGTVLQLKALGIDNMMQFEWLAPPPAEAMVRALELLHALGALGDDARWGASVQVHPSCEDCTMFGSSIRLWRHAPTALQDSTGQQGAQDKAPGHWYKNQHRCDTGLACCPCRRAVATCAWTGQADAPPMGFSCQR